MRVLHTKEYNPDILVAVSDEKAFSLATKWSLPTIPISWKTRSTEMGTFIHKEAFFVKNLQIEMMNILIEMGYLSHIYFVLIRSHEFEV